MAMPLSGTLYLCNSTSAGCGSCRSIAHAVYGSTPPSNVSLSSAGIQAGVCNIFTGQVNHSCFYGYTGTLTISLTMQVGGTVDGFSGTVYLRNSSGTAVKTSSIPTTTTTHVDSWNDIPVGNTYRFDFSLVSAFVGRTSVNPAIYWEWITDTTTGVSDFTSFVGSSDSLSSTVCQPPF